MFQSSFLLRKNMCFALAIFYVVGLFHQSILEGCHMLMHLGEISSGEFQAHKLSDHQESHKHLALSLIDEMIDNSSNEDLPFEKNTQKQTKKISQICLIQPIENIQFISTKNKTPNYSNHIFPQNYSFIIIPPPKKL